MAESGHQAQRANFALRWRRSAAEAAPEVGPLRIVALDQVDLPRARPALQRLLAADCRLDAVKHIEIDEGLHALPLREAFDEPLAMLIDAAWQVVCHADVERAIGPAGKTIDVVRHAPQLAPLRPSGSSLPKHSDVARRQDGGGQDPGPAIASGAPLLTLSSPGVTQKWEMTAGDRPPGR